MRRCRSRRRALTAAAALLIAVVALPLLAAGATGAHGHGGTIVVTDATPAPPGSPPPPGGSPRPPGGAPRPAPAPRPRTSVRPSPCKPACGSAAEPSRQWSQSVTLPAPSLRVRPGYAVTGLTAYLEIVTANPWAVVVPDPIRANSISISCHHTGFEVDWGDGTPVRTTTSSGGPYPAGDVTHVYERAAPADPLVVTEHWTCSWADSLGARGTLSDLQSVGRLALEVREIQATNA